MVECSSAPCTLIVFYRVPAAGRDRHYEAVYLRGWYHGARPGDDATPQIAVTGYVGTIEPGEDVVPAYEVRAPHPDVRDVEREILGWLASRHGVAAQAIRETGRHRFPPMAE